MNAEQRVQELGLSPSEATLYVALLKSGGVPASQIAKEVGQRRTTAYATLKLLVQKGFVVAYLKKGRQVFVAEKPQNVAGYFQKRLRIFTESIPFLESLEKKELQSGGVRFIETVEELKRFYAGILREYRGRSYVAMGNANAWEDLDTEFFIQYRKDRARAQIYTKLLLSEDSRSRSPQDPTLLRETKFLPPNYSFKSTIDIFDDKVLIMSSDQAALAVVIAVPAMVDIFHSIFAFMWDVSK